MAEVEPKIAFDHLHQTLVDYQARFVDMGLKGAGIELLFLGWLLTSREARAFIAESLIARFAAVAGITLMTAAGVLLIGRLVRSLRHVQRELDALDYLPRSYYAFRVPTPQVTTFIIMLTLAPWAITVILILFGVRRLP